ncbi:MAG: exosortase [Sedimentisphaerales bacterium]|nr:exosortase [Sedimentisphaerales bacterium]
MSKDKVKVIILAGNREFGRCPLAAERPPARWPIENESVLERLLRRLSHQGMTQAIICCLYGEMDQLRDSIGTPDGMQLQFVEEQLPLGTAGSIRHVIQGDDGSLLLVLHANMICPPNIDKLVEEHRYAQADMTVVLHPEINAEDMDSEAAGVYLCESSVLEFIPETGYCDIKETLVPSLLRAGRIVSMTRLARSVEGFRDWDGYMRAVSAWLESADKTEIDMPVRKSADGKNSWISPEADIDETVRIYGPVIIMDRAVIAENAVIIGPTILGRNVSIGRGAMISESILWDNARVGANCEVQKCLLDYHTILRDRSVLENELVHVKGNAISPGITTKIIEFIRKIIQQIKSFIQLRKNNRNQSIPGWIQPGEYPEKNNFPWLGVCAVMVAFIWSYWRTIAELWQIWARSDEYSCGLLVPFMAIYIAWSRRKQIRRCRIQPSLWGIPVFLAAQGLRFFGLFFMYGSAERFSLVVSIAALVFLLFGREVFRKSLTILLFLLLMLPLPKSFEARITLPLQSLATSSAVFSLEMLAYEVTTEGNIIHLGQTSVAVAEACNGLRMVTSFFVISGFVVFLVKREWWEKLIVLLSTLPIALLCNTIRLTLTSIAFTILQGEFWEKLFHDFGGYAMMPLALAIVVFELWVLTRIITVPVDHHKEDVLVIRSRQ